MKRKAAEECGIRTRTGREQIKSKKQEERGEYERRVKEEREEVRLKRKRNRREGETGCSKCEIFWLEKCKQ